ncbi:hypothetical protein [Chryseobacterium daeguense]|uniref:hypothetical protein n=1 Tax=Chryseobacterium daeguense TaxID=412438 RepID=UPI000409F0DA|nr:hypothetical protein [Chryseobacterium daeguense]
METAKGLFDWLYGFVRKPFSGWVALIGVIVYFFFWLLPERYDKGFNDAIKIDSLTITNLNKQLEELKLEKKNLQTKIDSTDCADQMQKAIELVNHFKSEIAKSNQKKIKALEKQNDFNKELEKYANNLEKNAQ